MAENGWREWTGEGDVAIVGMACLFPGAPDLQTYWQNILSNADAITDPPAEAWDPDAFYDPNATENDLLYCKRGGFLGPLAWFDPLEHNVMPLAVEGGEPDQWLALQVARAALADAGYTDEIPYRHRTAVILGKGNYPNRGNSTVTQHGLVVGQTLQILRTLHPEYTDTDLRLIRQELKKCLPPFNADTAAGLIPNLAAGRIANRLDLMGPAYTVDAACASFLVALDAAVRNLRYREIDMALVGGVHAWTPAPMVMLFCQLGALSRRQQIRPFDKDADGTILGEGVGMVVLKRREDAERDGSRIYALIRGVGVSSDGRGVGVLAPRLEGEVLALERAYANASVSPRTLGLIEAHGTGTPAGDLVEIQALTEVFGPRCGALPWCAVGSVKSMVGHLMPAAGAAGLIKTALALYHKTLPPSLNVDEPNPKLELEKTPFYINSETRPWIHGAADAPRRAGVNAFGFGGINAHAILEEYPETDDTAFRSYHPTWEAEVCILSAASRSELIQRVEQLQQFLRAGPRVDLKDLAYTLNVPTPQGAYRLAIVTPTIEDLQQKLDRAAQRLADPRSLQIKDIQGLYFFERPVAASGQLAFLFPGEGSQYLNMLADLCVHFPEVRRHFDVVDRVFAAQGREFLPSDFIFPPPAFSAAERKSAEERLWLMEGAVEAVLTANRALFALLRRLEIHPDAVLGHSSGEYSAMLAAGMIELRDETGIGEFATELNQIYRQAAVEGEIPRATLVAVGADVGTVSACIGEGEGDIRVAMDNCPHQAVIVGSEEAVERVVDLLRGRGVICERLAFDRPYHTPMFEGFARKLEPFFARWLLASPRIPTYTCTTMSPFPADVVQSRRAAVEHWTRPVEFRKTIEAMYANGVRVFVEVGPRGNLTAFVGDILRGRPHLAVSANVTNRSGIAQLNHLVGILAAQGVAMRLNYLYAHRRPRKLALDRPGDSEGGGRRSQSRIKLATGWPSMGLSRETAARLRHYHEPAAGVPSPPLRPQELVRESPPASWAPPTPAISQGAPGGGRPGLEGDAASFDSRPAVSSGQLVSAYLRTMEQFLGVQQEVMQAFLTGPRAAPAPPVRTAPRAVTGEAPAGGGTEAPGSRGASAEGNPGTTVSEYTGAVELLPRVSVGPEVSRSVRAEASAPTAEAIRTTLLQLVSERTGYPVEMLDLNLDLEADLGIDSIKRVEILGALQRRMELFQPEDMEGLAGRKTLQQVISFLTTRQETQNPQGAVAPVGAAGSAPSLGTAPLIGTVVSLKPGEELIALREFNLDEDRFLRDHTLGRQVSVADPALRGLPVVPLTMSMEMMAEAAAVLAPGQRVLGMRDVRAYRWAALDEGRLTVKLVARRDPVASGHEVQVQIYECEDAEGTTSPTPLAEGAVIVGGAYTEPSLEREFSLRSERSSKWTPDQLYQSVMFHGPVFRGVVSIDRTGADGAVATLEVRPTRDLFRSTPDPPLLTDPVLLDQPGQVVGFWTAEHLDTGYVIFPFRFERLDLYGPNLEPPERIQCRARIHLVRDREVRSDLDLVRGDGRAWARFVGWEDRRFDLPQSFFRALFSLQDVLLCSPWAAPLAHLPSSEVMECCRLDLTDLPEEFFEAHGGLWRRVVAHLVLSRREREVWHSLKGPTTRRTEWLLGRIVAKDAVRRYLKRQHGMALCPADVEIWPDDHGRPLARGAWLRDVQRAPVLSLSHAKGTAAAVADDGTRAIGVGVDIERIGPVREGTEEFAFTPAERALLSSVINAGEDSWLLRLWCAKEAAAKALGQGLVGGPQALVVQALDPHSGRVQLSLAGELARRARPVQGLTAFTLRERDLIAAIALLRSEGKGEA